MRSAAGRWQVWTLAGLVLSGAMEVSAAGVQGSGAAAVQPGGRNPFSSARGPSPGRLSAPVAIRDIAGISRWAPSTLRPVGLMRDAEGEAQLLLAPDGGLHLVRMPVGTASGRWPVPPGIAAADGPEPAWRPAPGGRPS